MNIQKGAKKFRNLNVVIFIALLCGYCLQVVVCLIPNSMIEERYVESAYILQREGLYPSIYAAGTYLDNWTDADCLAVAYNVSSQNPFYNAINAFQRYFSKAENKWGVNDLIDDIEGRADSTADHSYLWNGFRFLLRILLIRYNISEIRQILAGIILALIVMICNKMLKLENGKLICISFLLSVIGTNFQLESVSFLFFIDIFIAFVGCLLLLKIQEKNEEKIYLIFGLTGTLVAFMSMLIIPSITVGFPLIVLIILNKKSKSETKIKRSIVSCASWVYGYGITMLLKVLISAWLINSEQGILNVSRYLGMSSDYTLYARFVKLFELLKLLFYNSGFLRDIWILFVIVIVVMMIKDIQTVKKNIIQFLLLFAAFCIPFVWILVVTGHSHHNFTLFNFSISLFAISEICRELIIANCKDADM